MTTVFIHEYVNGGGMCDQPLPASWLREGAMMRSAVARDFAAISGVRVIATLDKRLPADRETWSTVRVGPGEEERVFRRLAEECDWTLLIAPETGGLLQKRAEWIVEAGGKSLGCTPDTIGIAGDKWQTFGLLARDSTIRQPKTVLLRSASDWPANAPAHWVVKPVDGAGCVDTFMGSELLRPDRPFQYPSLLQEYIHGSPMSVSLLIAADGKAIEIGIATQDIGIAGQALGYIGGAVPQFHPEGTECALRVATWLPGARGWVGVDMIADEQRRVTVLEVNPRLTTSFVGFQRLVPLGMLARAWLGLAGNIRDELAEAAIAQIVDQTTVWFETGRGA